MEILVFLLGLGLVVLLAKLLSKSLSFIKKLIVNSISGFILLKVVNLIGGIIGLKLTINLVSCLVVGFFGNLGLLALLLIELL